MLQDRSNREQKRRAMLNCSRLRPDGACLVVEGHGATASREKAVEEATHRSQEHGFRRRAGGNLTPRAAKAPAVLTATPTESSLSPRGRTGAEEDATPQGGMASH